MHTFTTSLEWKPGTEEADLACEGKPTLAITPPPAFGGKAECWSPEDALVGAVESCLLLTALYFVGKAKIGLSAYRICSRLSSRPRNSAPSATRSTFP